MTQPVTRRTALKTFALAGLAGASGMPAQAGPFHHGPAGWVSGRMTGAQALVETLVAEGTGCVFGIPGAQENELWDAMKSRGLPYLLVTHEASASFAADGYARSTGCPGVLCVVPGPGITNALTGIGEALLDSIPMVCIVGDVACGDQYRPFQVHELPQAALLRPVTKGVREVRHPGEIPQAVREAFLLARSGEPGPAAVVVPYNLLIQVDKYQSPPLGEPALPFDEAAFQCALGILSNPRLRVGIYAGLGCMSYAPALVQAAELLQAPVATSVSGKGVIDECHPLAVGWGYGPQGTGTAEAIFKNLDVVLAIGVRYSEVSTAFYNIPKHRHVIHVDINPNNLGRVVKASVCVNADAGVFLARLLESADCVRRCPDGRLQERIRHLKAEDCRRYLKHYATCGVDPMGLILALRRVLPCDALVYVDVSLSEHWAAEAFCVRQPRTYFNPTDNQAMGWSIPAALGGQIAHRDRTVVTLTGDGCFLMSAMEISTAARAGLPVKFFVLDDQAYHYMQVLQHSAYRRTTATVLAHLDYAAFAQALGVGYHEINGSANLDEEVKGALCREGPVLVRVVTDYGKRPVRWIEATKDRFTEELSAKQKARFLARIGSRSLKPHPWND
jgi:acetolactate synthase I/II/III large subunit